MFISSIYLIYPSSNYSLKPIESLFFVLRLVLPRNHLYVYCCTLVYLGWGLVATTKLEQPTYHLSSSFHLAPTDSFEYWVTMSHGFFKYVYGYVLDSPKVEYFLKNPKRVWQRSEESEKLSRVRLYHSSFVVFDGMNGSTTMLLPFPPWVTTCLNSYSKSWLSLTSIMELFTLIFSTLE